MIKAFEQHERAFEDAIADRYDRDYHVPPIMWQHDQDFADYVAEFYAPGDRVLDLGCASASLWPQWEAKLAAPRLLIGVDLSPGMLRQGKRAAKNAKLAAGSMFQIPVPSGSFDIVVASSILHHIPDQSLTEALDEIHRVLDEHGTLVGREPISSGKLGDAPGWLSGALMAFRHMVYRMTHTREYPEPAAGEEHHAYVPEEFLRSLEKVFRPRGLKLRNPVSSFVQRSEHPLVMEVARVLDEAIDHWGGFEFFYAARKNFFDAQDVSECIRNELNSRSDHLPNEAEFLALLQSASDLLERELAR
jgi:ubiquinone/menaquinone biosynthesis C-methylase UbiE